jgi:hypothetical protein
MGTDNGDSWQPRSRVGALVVALINGDEAAAAQVAEEPQDTSDAERVAEEPQDDKESPVLAAAIRLAVRSLFDEDTTAESMDEYLSTMARDVGVNPDIAQALIRTQLGDEHLLDAFPPQDVIDTTWSVLGYLCERQLGRDDSLLLMAQAEEEAL